MRRCCYIILDWAVVDGHKINGEFCPCLGTEVRTHGLLVCNRSATTFKSNSDLYTVHEELKFTVKHNKRIFQGIYIKSAKMVTMIGELITPCRQ